MDEDKITADKNVIGGTTNSLAQEIADLKQTIKGYDTQLKAAIDTIMKPRRRIMPPSSPLVAKTTTGLQNSFLLLVSKETENSY
jgi:hypothetical protein